MLPELRFLLITLESPAHTFHKTIQIRENSPELAEPSENPSVLEGSGGWLWATELLQTLVKEKERLKGGKGMRRDTHNTKLSQETAEKAELLQIISLLT